MHLAIKSRGRGIGLGVEWRGGGGAGLVSATTGGDFIRRPIPSVEHLIMQLFRASGI